ncbi:MAG: proton-conducting transporter membrane subunit [Phycisphaerae bacterium]
MTLTLVLIGVLLIAVSGVPGLAPGLWTEWGQRAATVLTVMGSLLGLSGGFYALGTGLSEKTELPGIFPGTMLHLRMDSLSAFFLVLIFFMAAAGAVYGEGYWRQRDHPGTGQQLRLLYGMFVAAMAMVTLAYDAWAFLMAWEIMALTSYFLIATEDENPECRQAAWIYLVATHLGTLSLLAMFALLHHASGTFLLQPVPLAAGVGITSMIFLLALLGFGLKAGIMPLHFWLPGAHANAPSHISALLSGVLLKVGIYGLLRILTLLPNPPGVWGVLILTLGTINAVLGVAFALGQHDIKRLLAYHSIENIGIILMGLGLALIGIALHRPVWVVLGIAGCLLHVWNHGLFKSLLFFSAGSVVHATHTRDIDSLGGLAKLMPLSAGLFMLGAAAICGLPPLNGFVSELLVYLGLLGPAASVTAGGWAALALAAAALAVVGALAVACFVKVFGAVFLGVARTAVATKVHESPASMIGPMAVLAGLCAIIGIAPVLVVLPLSRAATKWIGNAAVGPQLAHVVPWEMLTAVNVCLAGVLLALMAGVRVRRWFVAAPRVPTWACGYVRPTNRMQYTAASFAEMLVGLMGWVLRPVRHGAPGSALFVREVEVESHVPALITDRVAFSWWHKFKDFVAPARRTQQGQIQHYMLYFLLALFVLMCSLIPVAEVFRMIMRR